METMVIPSDHLFNLSIGARDIFKPLVQTLVCVGGLKFIFLSFLRARGGVLLFYGFFSGLDGIFGVVLCSTATETTRMK